MTAKTAIISEYNLVEFIYHTYMKQDFPRNELKPLASIRNLWEQGRYDCYQMREEGNLVGYAFFVKQTAAEKNSYLLDYLAIVPGYRDRGYGSLFLQELSQSITDAYCIVSEVEDPDKAEDEAERQQMQRRLSFYLRGGYRKTQVTARVFGVSYRVLEVPCSSFHPDEEIREIYASLYRSMLPAAMYKAFIKLT